MDDHLEVFDDGGTIKINGTMMVAYLGDASDRTMAYYHWDGASWTGHDLPVYPTRNGFGSMSQFSDGRVAICTHGNIDGGGTRAFAAYDAYPGIRAFSYFGTSTSNVRIWPHISVNSDGSISMVATNQSNSDVWVVTGNEATGFGEWDLNFRLLAPHWMDNDMEWPSIHSGTNGKVGVVIPDIAGAVRLFESTDNGGSWGVSTIAQADTADLPSGIDSTATRLGWLNSDIMYIGDEPHVAWSAGQGVRVSGDYGLLDFKATIYHWSPSTGIDEVVVAETQSADDTRPDYVPVPYNHLGVDWPMMGLAADGETLVMAFTAFNIDDIDETSLPPAGFVDIWVTSSVDNGNTWSAPANVTNPDGTVLGWDDRYPSLARTNIDNAADPGKDVYMIYQSDDRAGTWVQGTEGAVNMDYVKFLGIDLDVLPEGLSLAEPTPGIAGVDNTFEVTGATPGEWIKCVYGLRPGSTTSSDCPGVTLDIDSPTVVGGAIADSSGVAAITAFIPDRASGQTVLFQAIEKSSCEETNLVEYTFP
jgi:hypothetical protein